jgi:hypothetical protein
MSKSNWVTISGILVGLFVAIIGGVWHLSFKIGSLDERVMSVERSVEKLDNRVGQMSIEIGEIRGDIKEMQGKIAEMQVKMSEMGVKLDLLWKVHFSKSDSSTTLRKTATARH